ncbi:MAG: carbon-nitrogen hydrolase family protein [Steroidobacteraceae bacterium]
MTKFIAAAVQWAPIVHDSAACADKAVQAIADAAREGARLVVLPEAWIPGYPYWAGTSIRSAEYQGFLQEFNRQAIRVPGPETERIQAAAAKHQCTVVFGCDERAAGSIYCTIVYIGSDGRLLGKHRKLMPTLTERMVWAMGDGSDLEAYDTDCGRIGGLNCFEHHMALARYAVGSLGVQVHASLWPGYEWLNPIVDACTRQLAFENACFVVVAREVMSPEQIAVNMPQVEIDRSGYQMTGGSAIIAPGGTYLAGPVSGEKETIVCAEIDLDRCLQQKWWFDGYGHYARPDVMRLDWDRRAKRAVRDRD